MNFFIQAAETVLISLGALKKTSTSKRLKDLRKGKNVLRSFTVLIVTTVLLAVSIIIDNFRTFRFS